MKRITWIACCWLLLGAAHAASFDCSKASTEVERMICGDAALSKLDEELARKYKEALKNVWSEKLIPHYQKLWMKGRNLCKSVSCLNDSYFQRIAELNEHYKLVMSKDTKLCDSILDLYNEDMKSIGRIKYEKHEIFSNIEWKDDSDLGLMHAIFDINNDGKNELVLKSTRGFHGIESDTLYIFPADSDVFSKLKPGAGGLKVLFDNPNRFFSQDGYHFKELPNSREASVDVYFITHPFIWAGTSYISLTDITPQWVVIAKYLKAEELQDVCYFYDKNIKHWEIDDLR
jgi:uncharacterized protein YecT (DUF1311 family)